MSPLPHATPTRFERFGLYNLNWFSNKRTDVFGMKNSSSPKATEWLSQSGNSPTPSKPLKPSMNPYQLAPVLFICLLAFLSAAEPPKPNIILIIPDDQRFCDYGFMGSKTAVTPNLDRLAAQSQLYTHGSRMPVCSPSPATLLTGLLPHRHGITGKNLATERVDEVKRLESIRVSAWYTH